MHATERRGAHPTAARFFTRSTLGTATGSGTKLDTGRTSKGQGVITLKSEHSRSGTHNAGVRRTAQPQAVRAPSNYLQRPPERKPVGVLTHTWDTTFKVRRQCKTGGRTTVTSITVRRGLGLPRRRATTRSRRATWCYRIPGPGPTRDGRATKDQRPFTPPPWLLDVQVT